MPSCDATDQAPKLMRGAMPLSTSPVSTSRQDCPKEKYCEEVVQGRPQCPPGRCLYGGKEHAKIPCPDHDRPFGRVVGEGPAAKAKGVKATKRRPKKKTAGRRKVTARSAPKRKASKKKKTTKR